MGHLAGRNVLCAIDGTPKSAPLMEWAAEFAKDTGATLRLVHAVSGIQGWPERQLDREFEEDLRAQARGDDREDCKSPLGSRPRCVWRSAMSRERSAKKPSGTTRI